MDEFSIVALKPSRIAIGLQSVVLGSAVAAIGLSGLSWEVKSGLIFLLLLTGFYDAHKQRNSLISDIGYGHQQCWVMKDQEKVAIELVGEQLVLPWLVVIQWREKESGIRSALALWPDSAHQEDLRRLRVFLRFG